MIITPERRNEIVEGLLSLAAFIETCDPNLLLPERFDLNVYSGNMLGPDGLSYSLDSKEGLALIAKSLRSCDKSADASHFTLTKEFSPAVSIKYVAFRNAVCEPVVIGQRVVPAVPAQPAQPERIEDVIEYRCPALFSALPKPTSSVDMSTPALAAPVEGEYLALPKDTEDFIPF